MPTAVTGAPRFRHENPLEKDILAAGILRTKSKKRKARRDEDDGQEFVDAKASRKILKIGQQLQDEDRDEQPNSTTHDPFSFGSRFPDHEDEEDFDKYEDEEAWEEGDDDNGQAGEGVEIDPHDLEMFNKFMPSTEEPTLELNSKPPESQGTNLADLILAQIAAQEAQQDGDERRIIGGGAPEDAIEIPEKVVEVYTQVGMIMSRFRSGRLPKPFKILPTLEQWEDLIHITRPESWTPNACYEATRIFVSANKRVVRQFIEMILLDRVRDDIHETGKLNVHLFRCLQKCTYKPEAFFKGFLFPLVESGICTRREAHVVSGVLTRASIPALHSAAAIMRLTDIAAEQASAATEAGGATNVFIKALLEKGYALPYKVIDNLVFHFLRFRGNNPDAMQDENTAKEIRDLKLTVIWHQTLLAFAQRYRNDITEDQREALLDLLIIKGHKDIGPEVRRELLQGRGRGVVVAEQKIEDGGDDTMVMEV